MKNLKIRYSILSILAATSLIGLGLFAFSFMYRSEPPIPVFPSTSKDSPVISIFRYSSLGLESEYHEPFIEFAIWRDGKVVWRKEASDPQSPLLTNQVNPIVIDELFKELSAARLLDPDLRTFHVGPGSGYVSIEIATDQRVVELASWHEQFSHLNSVVCTDLGVEAIEPNQDKQNVIATWSRNYKLFRENWGAIRELVNELKDISGRPFEGSIPVPGQVTRNKLKAEGENQLETR